MAGFRKHRTPLHLFRAVQSTPFLYQPHSSGSEDGALTFSNLSKVDRIVRLSMVDAWAFPTSVEMWQYSGSLPSLISARSDQWLSSVEKTTKTIEEKTCMRRDFSEKIQHLDFC